MSSNMLAFMRGLEGSALFKQVWFHTFPIELWKQVASAGLTDLDEIAKRADIIQESLKLEKWLLLVLPREVHLHLFIVNREANLGGVDPTEERDKSFTQSCVLTMPNWEIKHTNMSHPALRMIVLKPSILMIWDQEANQVALVIDPSKNVVYMCGPVFWV